SVLSFEWKEIEGIVWRKIKTWKGYAWITNGSLSAFENEDANKEITVQVTEKIPIFNTPEALHPIEWISPQNVKSVQRWGHWHRIRTCLYFAPYNPLNLLPFK
ncbi:hypothetical protein ACEQ6C_38130, partial [Rhizobium ruizarguesonis]